MPSQTLNEYPIPNHPGALLERGNAQSKLDAAYIFLQQRAIGHQPAGDDFIQRCREQLLHIALQSSSIPSPLLLVNFDLLNKNAPIVGSGGSAHVFVYGAGKAIVAVKKFFYSRSTRTCARMTYIRETMIISSNLLRHANIIEFLGAIDNGTEFAIVTPYLINGNLPSFLRQNPNADRLKMAKGIACGLSHLKFCGVIHSDLKGSNVLVNDDHIPVISDFGLAVYEGNEIGFDECRDISSWCGSDAGTARYMAPERLSPKAGSSTRPTFSSDIFSFGMVLYEIYTGKIPYRKLNDCQAMIQIVNGIHPTYVRRIPDYVWPLALSCWSSDPSDRPEVEKIVNYLSGVIQRKT